MMTLDQQIAEQKLEDLRAKLDRLQYAYFQADDRVKAAQAKVRQAEDRKARALLAYKVASERLHKLEHPEEY